MLKVGDTITVKTLSTLVDEGLLKKDLNIEDVYVNEDIAYILFSDFPYFGKECTIQKIDKKDSEIPYFVSVPNKFGIWLPEFMIQTPNENINIPEKQENQILVDDNNLKLPIINQFNGKPFGKLFIKLISLDSKIAEFSDTAFSKLKKHELLYIVNVIKTNLPNIEYPKNIEALNQRELATFCFRSASKLK